MDNLNRLESILNSLEQFKQDQFEYWEEVKGLSEEVILEQALEPIIEEEDSSNEIAQLVNQINSLISYLREGEIKIVEQYKYELKQLALEMKEMTKKSKSIHTQTDSQNYEQMYLQEKSKSQLLERQLLAQKKNDESNLRKEIEIELGTVRNKIHILTQTAAEAEALLLKKDSQNKENLKQISKLQKELTQKRCECSSMHEQLRIHQQNLQIAQNQNRNHEQDITKLTQQLKRSNSIKKNTQQPCYQNLASEIEELTHQNQHLKTQIQSLNKRIKELNEELIIKEDLIQQMNVNENENAQLELREAMEYLEMKDMQIYQLHRELEQCRRGNPQQLKDLQSLLVEMSKQLQAKDQELLYYRN